MSWLEAVQLRLPWLPQPPERRSEADIERDLEDEFAFHIDRSANDLIKDGIDPNEARRQASARFGDVVSIKKVCRRIALRERIMLQRVNLVLMVVVMVIVVVVGVQVMMTQRYNTLALQAITADLGRMKFEAGAATASVPPTVDASYGKRSPGTTSPTNWISLLTPSFWRQVGEDGSVIEGGASLEILARSDIRGKNSAGSEPTAILNLPDRPHGPPAFVAFMRSFQLLFFQNRNESGPSDVDGRWTFVNDRLLLDISSARTEEGKSLYPEPLHFIKQDTEAPKKTSLLDRNANSERGFIYVDGSIGRPGVYSLPEVGKLTLTRFIVATGGVAKDIERCRVTVRGQDRMGNTFVKFTTDDLNSEASNGYVMAPEDHVILEALDNSAERPAKKDG